MWTKIAPELVRQHPWGIGYRSLTNDMMRRIAPEVEPERDHLHSNLVQVLVDSGWLGLALYLFWMSGAIANAASLARKAQRLWAAPEPALILLLAMAGLFANGLVEYNFGDAEIVLLYGFIMGSASSRLSA